MLDGNEALVDCRLCPRLVAWREEVAREKRRAYQHEDYWGKPVPAFGDLGANILILGLAPGAHGSNRTGRMFTGDASGEFLYPALYRAGLASKAFAISRDDGMELKGVYITAALRCVPPENKPRPEELRRCRRWLEPDLNLPQLNVILALGKIAHDSYLDYLKSQHQQGPNGKTLSKGHYPFKHGATYRFKNRPSLVDSYHVSFQNTNTGKLSEVMFDEILTQVKALATKEI
ncbi:MAG: uracil-DNA glycosylase [Deinococcales bacterium]